MKKNMRAKDVAKYASIVEGTVWKYVREGKLSTTKVSKKLTLFDRNEVEKFFSKNNSNN